MSKHPHALHALLSAGLVLLFGCSDAGNAADEPAKNDTFNADTADTDTTAVPPRSFRMAAAPFKFDVNETQIRSVFDMSGFDGQMDVLSLHIDNFFGVPWDEFASGAPLPRAWLNEMTKIKSDADPLETDIYLALTPINGMRSGIAAKALDVSGSLAVDDGWAPGCYNFDTGPEHAAVQTAFLTYVRWMVDFFDPVFLTLGIEMDLYDTSCPTAYDSLISLLNLAYDQEKAHNADLPIFPTLTADNMWWTSDTADCFPDDRACLRANLAKIEPLKRDRIGISSYPIWVFSVLGYFKEDYYSAFAEETGEPIVFGEVGWNNHDVEVPYPTLEDPCTVVSSSDDLLQTEFMEFLFKTADAQGADLLVWWSFRDYLPDHMLSGCPCDSPSPWCVLYDALAPSGLLAPSIMWGSMGVIDYSLAPKGSFDTWRDWLNRPLKI